MMRRMTLIVCCILALFAVGEGNEVKSKHVTENPVVTTPLGQIRGSLMTSRLGKTINAFRGIRYAKPPVDELRFQPPVPVEKWGGVYDATKDGFLCPQPSTSPVSEDCLIVNVYSTQLPRGSENPKRPVIVHIHPGGYYSATSVSYWAGPQYYMDQDIVLVTFNYRLGSLGFLSTGDKEAPGNNGLKDQVVLLKWVKQNIEAFGGDPNSVTIQGCSAGSWSVILHMVSPLSQGLFHKGVSMSGTPVGAWMLPHNQLEIAKKQARIVGCPDDTSANIIKCLKTKPFKELGDSLFQFREFGYDPVLIWSPVIEDDFGQTRFLTAHPIDLIQSGKFQNVPFITGITTDEFGYYAFNVVNNETLTKQINKDFYKIAPIAFIYERDTNRSKIVSEGVKKSYLHDKPVDQSQFTALANLYSDAIVGFSVNRAAKLISQYSSENVYYYRFSYQGRYSHFYLPDSNNTTPYGVVHHDDLIYLFYISKLFPWFNATSPEVEMVEKLTTLYANFAKTGNPTPTSTDKLDSVKWEPFTLKDQKYLDIGKKLIMNEKLYEERYAEWEKLYPLNQISHRHHDL
ncbi:venom carboxylesterase-6-like [Anoplophora glabripennis]|uniref:venom carboxylesterase-6-like n=1 Tax=Anoplophora glabripennis TaxID=217634 RepID=UPI000C760A7F|nr:venom carboxylesterase-6-like [Anoplophora glabripennis]XP_023312048.1 venom carboxylesterase-6-like [Anoplophora glabripennis]XP_023312049.1 venom carboxylesterase-6-like [Anoplophora glabripennis]